MSSAQIIIPRGHGAPPALVTCGEDRTILAAALQEGIGFPYECASGGCGACRYELLAGSVETLWDAAPGLSARDRKKGNRHLACQTRPLGDITIAVALAGRYAPPVPVQTLIGSVEVIKSFTHDMVELHLRTTTPARFVPGQFMLLGDAPPQGIRRAYSMAGLPDEGGLWRFYLKRVPGGRFTSEVMGHLAEGASLAMEGPFGLATYRPQLSPVLCIAGGSGLAPMVSVARAALADPDAGNIHLFYGARTANDIVEPARLGLPAPGGRFSFTMALSAESGAEWNGPRGLIHEVVDAAIGERVAEHEIFVAGPPLMVEAVVRMLLGYGVERERIHFDAFY
ncbi:MAG: 2Fe-2S iron-sulfur cluster binding domain-containing protein [Bradyrhizobium sp.]|uniref:2Fe-2S iron-sulfur cluster binding domain-containing protein n=1 Tax=Bradyrhizobium sp. TaxID=376 RepID=UPI0025C30B63|nr:2Fe-2S iron-sulfur cluster binding domain-containing protein [Bradyrhizobium sp.]MBI5263430.1 2Fe-2S iron-sulfur cluster binding domain-containing protein [Bradyrhizobium sp.]